MSLKGRVWLIIISLFAVLTVVIFFLTHQVEILFQIASIYWMICVLLWGIFFIFLGVKQLRQEHQKGRHLHWNQSLFVVIGLGVALPPVLNVRLWWNEGQIGHTNWPIINYIEIIGVSLFLIILLFFEVILTVGLIRSFLNTAKSFQFFKTNQSK